MYRISTKDVATMTNAQIVAEYERHSARQSEHCKTMIAAGLGHIRPSDMRQNPDMHAVVPEYIALMDRCAALQNEGRRRYGPGFFLVEFLTRDMPKSYRRAA